jgi:peptidoglycan/LPS O-acetylase OafA/YrhL
MGKSRIGLLDSFRALSILSVMLFHFFSHPLYEINGYYPSMYAGKFQYFKYGNLGVHFFFMISGFVISYTLIKTESIFQFWIKRWVRLFPSMLIASLFLFIFYYIINDNILFPEVGKFYNFIPSLTFINPAIYNFVLSSRIDFEFNWLNGSYWSLWPEIQFYILISAIYFFNKKNFFFNYIIIALFIIIMNWLIGNISGKNIFKLDTNHFLISNYRVLFEKYFNLPTYLIQFTLGVIFFKLYQLKNLSLDINNSVFIVAIMLSFYFIYSGFYWQIRIIYTCMIFLFYLFIYYPDYIHFLSNSYFSKIGIASYFIYLIHEPLGLIVIYKYVSYFSRLAFLFTIILIMVIIAIGVLYHKYLEKSINSYLRQNLNLV